MQVGELNDAMVRYLEDAIREQEQRVKSEKGISGSGSNNLLKEVTNEKEDAMDVTRGDDGTIRLDRCFVCWEKVAFNASQG